MRDYDGVTLPYIGAKMSRGLTRTFEPYHKSESLGDFL